MPERPIESDLVAALLSPPLPMSGLWFLHALIAFFVVGKLIRRVPAWIQITFAALLACAAWAFRNFGSVSYNGDGALLPVEFRRGDASARRALAYNERVRPLALADRGGGVRRRGAGRRALPPRSSPRASCRCWVCSAVVTGALGARALASTVVRRPLAYLGRTTLPIYVTHVILVAAVITAIEATGVTVPARRAARAPARRRRGRGHAGAAAEPRRAEHPAALPLRRAEVLRQERVRPAPSRIRRQPTRLPESA